ncbi:SPFH domain-containing protein [Streptomyces sp. CS090A]|uniref:SPFH domain-containing protein n=1 Tax=Streptomyces sp. CS090A TaxID=2162710 RepID=UPI001EF66AC0|nr:SPFH domain-containing protein [Streptomyces sp. CS090A]
MSPDQNPHPLTDHDGRTSGGETPMPLVDDVALHRPALPTPPPLFRPKEEVQSVGENPLVGEGPLPVEDPLPGEASPEGPDELAASALAQGSDPASAQDSALAQNSALAQDSDPAPAPHSALDPDPTSAPTPASAPRPPLKPIRLVHPGRSLHLDQFKPAPAPSQPARPESPENLARPEPDLPPFQPVRRLRTEPSAEWTPLPAYGEEAGPRPAPDAQTDKDKEKETPPGLGVNGATGTDTATDLDLVLDLANGPRATSATVSVSVPAPHPPPHPRRHSVIAGESTASIPVHLLFRDDPEQPEPAALPTTVARPTTGPGTPADRTPRPRSPHPRVEPPTRPAPLADPRLVERPGPALPGYAALLTGAAGLLGVLALLWWRGALPAAAQSAVGLAPRPYEGMGAGVWAGLALLVTVVVLALGGLGRGRVGYAWVLTLFGDYRGSVRRTGLVWVSPLLLRRRVDVRLRHWRSEPLPAVDANGTALRVVVLVVWRIKDTVRAALGIEDHEAYLSAQVESAMARVLSQLPADAFHEDAPTLRNAEAVGDALTRMLKADCEPVGVEVYSAQPTGIEYAPEVAAAMQRRRIAAIDAKHRDSVLTSVVDAVDDTVNRLTTRGIVDLDDYERKALVKDLTVAFYTGRTGGGDSA